MKAPRYIISQHQMTEVSFPTCLSFVRRQTEQLVPRERGCEPDGFTNPEMLATVECNGAYGGVQETHLEPEYIRTSEMTDETERGNDYSGDRIRVTVKKSLLGDSESAFDSCNVHTEPFPSPAVCASTPESSNRMCVSDGSCDIESELDRCANYDEKSLEDKNEPGLLCLSNAPKLRLYKFTKPVKGDSLIDTSSRRGDITCRGGTDVKEREKGSNESGMIERASTNIPLPVKDTPVKDTLGLPKTNNPTVTSESDHCISYHPKRIFLTVAAIAGTPESVSKLSMPHKKNEFLVAAENPSQLESSSSTLPLSAIFIDQPEKMIRKPSSKLPGRPKHQEYDVKIVHVAPSNYGPSSGPKSKLDKFCTNPSETRLEISDLHEETKNYGSACSQDLLIVVDEVRGNDDFDIIGDSIGHESLEHSPVSLELGAIRPCCSIKNDASIINALGPPHTYRAGTANSGVCSDSHDILFCSTTITPHEEVAPKPLGAKVGAIHDENISMVGDGLFQINNNGSTGASPIITDSGKSGDADITSKNYDRAMKMLIPGSLLEHAKKIVNEDIAGVKFLEDNANDLNNKTVKASCISRMTSEQNMGKTASKMSLSHFSDIKATTVAKDYGYAVNDTLSCSIGMPTDSCILAEIHTIRATNAVKSRSITHAKEFSNVCANAFSEQKKIFGTREKWVEMSSKVSKKKDRNDIIMDELLDPGNYGRVTNLLIPGSLSEFAGRLVAGEDERSCPFKNLDPHFISPMGVLKNGVYKKKATSPRKEQAIPLAPKSSNPSSPKSSGRARRKKQCCSETGTSSKNNLVSSIQSKKGGQERCLTQELTEPIWRKREKRKPSMKKPTAQERKSSELITDIVAEPCSRLEYHHGAKQLAVPSKFRKKKRLGMEIGLTNSNNFPASLSRKKSKRRKQAALVPETTPKSEFPAAPLLPRKITQSPGLRSGHKSAASSMQRLVTKIKMITNEALEKSDVPKVQFLACENLRKIASTAEISAKVIELGGIDMIIRAMQNHPNKTIVQAEACNALGHFVWVDPSNGEKIVENGGLHLLVDVMNRLGTNAKVQQQGCGAFRALSCDKVNAQHIKEVGGIHVVLASMVRNPMKAQVQKEGCLFLQNMMMHSDETAPEVSKAGVIPGIVYAMSSNQGLTELQDAACSVLSNLALDQKTRRAILKAEAIPMIVSSLEKCDQVHVKAVACRALERLATDCPEIQEAATDAGTVQSVLSAIKTFPNEVDLFNAACGLLKQIAAYGDNALLILNEGGVERIISMMDENSKSPVVQYVSCSLLRRLCHGWCDYLTAKSMTAVIVAMRNHPRVENIQVEACRTLSKLVRIDSVVPILKEVKARRTLVDARSHFPERCGKLVSHLLRMTKT